MASRLEISGMDPNGLFARMTLPPRFRKRCKETRFRQEWKLTIDQYLQMMREFKGPKRQGGIIMAAMAHNVGRVKITDHTLAHTDVTGIGTNAESVMGFRADGTFYHQRSNAADIDPVGLGEWHTDEPSVTGADYEVREGPRGGADAWDFIAASPEVWVTLNVLRRWGVTRAHKNAPQFKSEEGDFELGLDGVESALDTAHIITTIQS